MDKATLSKKSVLALERLAKKVGAKTVTPEGKKKNKTQLVNSIVIASRLGKKNPALKTKKAPAKVAGRKTLNGNTTAKKVVAKKTLAKKYKFPDSSFPNTYDYNLRLKITNRRGKPRYIQIDDSGALYVNIGKYTYYFDNSTNEAIVKKYLTSTFKK